MELIVFERQPPGNREIIECLAIRSFSVVFIYFFIFPRRAPTAEAHSLSIDNKKDSIEVKMSETKVKHISMRARCVQYVYRIICICKHVRYCLPRGMNLTHLRPQTLFYRFPIPNTVGRVYSGVVALPQRIPSCTNVCTLHAYWFYRKTCVSIYIVFVAYEILYNVTDRFPGEL